MHDAEQHDDRAGGGEQRLQRLADERAEPAAGLAERRRSRPTICRGRGRRGAMPERGERRPGPSRDQAERARRLALADERDADGDQHDRHDEAAEPDEPADQRLDARAERAGEVEVDRQAEQDAADDEADADELVLAAVDRPRAARRWRRRGGRRWRAGVVGAASTRARRDASAAACAVSRSTCATSAPDDELAGRAAVASRRRARRRRASSMDPRWSWPGPRYQAGCHADRGIPLTSRVSSPGSTERTAPSGPSMTSSAPPAVGLHDDRVLHRAARPPTIDEQRRRRSRRARRRPRRGSSSGSNVDASAAANVSPSAAPAARRPAPARRRRRRTAIAGVPPSSADEQVDELRRGVDLEVLLRRRRARPRRPRSPGAISSTSGARRSRSSPPSTRRAPHAAERAPASDDAAAATAGAHASITTGTIIGRRRVRSLTNLPAARRTSRSSASTSRTPVGQRRLDGRGDRVARLVEQVLGLGCVHPAAGDDLRARRAPCRSAMSTVTTTTTTPSSASTRRSRSTP